MSKSQQTAAKVRVKLTRILATAGRNHRVGDVIEVSPQQAAALVTDRAATLVDPMPAIERSTSGPDARPKAGAGASNAAGSGATTDAGQPAAAPGSQPQAGTAAGKSASQR